jgi:hypothetical protein
MINVKDKLCEYNNCKTRASYNTISEKTPKYCLAHKLDNMINKRNMNCLYENCMKQPYYGYVDENKKLYCSFHKLENMKNLRDNKCCYENCEITATFNYEENNSGLFCSSHKLDGMIDVKHQKCKTPLCQTRFSNKYDGYCMFCYMNLFPDKPVSRNYKTKEYSVVENVKTNFPELTWVTDKKIQDGCSKRRPDLLLDLGYQIIIVEVDENQHIDYDCSCENKRIMELSQDVNHRPLIFIRFNPDEYQMENKTITSCWGINGRGICAVKKSKKKEWEIRLETLREQIRYWIDPINKTDKTIEVIQLFYDK